MPKINMPLTVSMCANEASHLNSGTLLQGTCGDDSIVVMVTDMHLYPFVNLKDGVAYNQEHVSDYTFTIIRHSITLEP